MLAFFNHHVSLRTPNVLRNWVTAVDDQWSWTTRDGRIFENVEVEVVEDHDVVLRHQFGTDRVPVEQLTEESLERLHGTSAWLEHLEAVPSLHSDSVHEEILKAA
jgi:hypothetical protein